MHQILLLKMQIDSMIKVLFILFFVTISFNLFAQQDVEPVVQEYVAPVGEDIAHEYAGLLIDNFDSPAPQEQGLGFSFEVLYGMIGILCIGLIVIFAYWSARKKSHYKTGNRLVHDSSCQTNGEDGIQVTAVAFQSYLPKGSLLKGISNDYIVKSVLGQGSFGITYLAYVRHKDSSAKSGNTLVAIKEFYMKDINGREGSTVTASSQEGMFDKYRNKFAKESRMIHSLSHPGIVKVLDCFEGNNTFYYVMEYVEGGSLNDYIEVCGQIPEEESLRYVRTIGTALEYMHSHNMVHLDIKPSNIMITKDGNAILIDFGLSKQYDENGIPESSTSIGGGTPGYAPIEQATFHSSPDLPVTMDVYALGATLFKMLTGVRPPEASAILNDGFPDRELIRYKISTNTVNSIMKAMAPLRKSRYPNISSFINDLADESTVRF